MTFRVIWRTRLWIRFLDKTSLCVCWGPCHLRCIVCLGWLLLEYYFLLFINFLVITYFFYVKYPTLLPVFYLYKNLLIPIFLRYLGTIFLVLNPFFFSIKLFSLFVLKMFTFCVNDFNFESKTQNWSYNLCRLLCKKSTWLFIRTLLLVFYIMSKKFPSSFYTSFFTNLRTFYLTLLSRI